MSNRKIAQRAWTLIKKPFIWVKQDVQTTFYKGTQKVGSVGNEKIFETLKTRFFTQENLFVWSIGLNCFMAALYYRMVSYDIVGVWQHSMRPTLKHQEKVIIRKFNRERFFVNDFTQQEIKQGDIVVFKNPKHPERLEVKRVIGLARDVVTPVKSTIQVNIDPEPVRLQQGYMFLEGDNMAGNNRQDDSNRFGPIPLGMAEGVVICKINWDNWKPVFSKIERAVPKDRVVLNNFVKKSDIKNLGDLTHEDMLLPGLGLKSRLSKQSRDQPDLMLAHVEAVKKREAGRVQVGGGATDAGRFEYRRQIIEADRDGVKAT